MSLLESGAYECFELGIVAALVGCMGGQDLADDGQERLFCARARASQVEAETLRQLPGRRRVVFAALLHVVIL